MGEFNIAPNTQIGKIIIPEQVYDDENAYHTDPDRYSRGGEFIENMVTDNYVEFCHRWFKLAGFEEMLDDIDEYFGVLGYGKYSNLMNAGYCGNGEYSPILPTVAKYQSPITISEKNKYYCPVVFHEPRNTNINYETLKESQENGRKFNG